MAKDKDGDLGFTFDTKPFEHGMKKIGDGMAGFQKSIGGMAKSVSKGVMNAVKKIGVIALAFKGVQSVLKEMPEVGQAFGIAKDVFMKNLLWPLRKAVFPMLQKLVDWVRDNRGMFVRWGQTLANIFHSVVGAVQKVIDIGKKMVNTFIGFINRVFGTSIRDLHDLLNILAFKFAVIMTFISGLIGPLFEQLASATEVLIDALAEPMGRIIGDIVKWVTTIGDAFFSELGPMFEEIMKPIGDIFDGISDIVNLLIGSEDALKTWKDVFGFLGRTVGTVLKVAFEAIAVAIKTIKEGIEALMEFFESSGFKDFIDGVTTVVEAIGGFFGGIDSFFGGGLSDSIEKQVERVERMIQALIDQHGSEEAYKIIMEKSDGKIPDEILKKFFPEKFVNDAIITKKGEVVRTSPDDMIIATKGFPGGNNNQVTVSVDFSGMSLNIQNATPSEASGFAETIVEQIRAQLQKELARIGA